MTDTAALHRYATTADPEAFKQLVQAYQGLVYAACRRKLGRIEDVDDAVQKTFIKLAQHAGTIRTDLAAWLHRCATNVSIDMVRRDAVRQQHEAAAAIVTTLAEDDPDWARVSAQVDDAVDELEDQERALIVGVFFDDRSRREIARELGISHTSANRRIDRAVLSLREALRCRGVVAPAGVLAAGLAGVGAKAQVPAVLTAELAKVGLVGAGQAAAAGAASTGGAIFFGLASGKLLAAGLTAVAGVGAVVGVATLSGPSTPRPGGSSQPPLASGGGAAVAMANDKEPEPDLADPLFHKPLVPTSLPDYAGYWIDVEDRRLFHRQKDGDAVSVFQVESVDPGTNPPRLDMRLVEMEGDATQGQIDNIGRVIRGIYRFQNQGNTLLIATGQLDEERPKRFPKTLFENNRPAVYFYGRLPQEYAAPNTAEGLADGRLAGPWYETDNCYIKPHGDQLRFYELLTPAEKHIGVLDLKEWVAEGKHRRLGTLVRIHTPEGDQVKPLRMIYEPTKDASVFRAANFMDDSPFQAQYPKGFGDRRRGIHQALFMEYRP